VVQETDKVLPLPASCEGYYKELQAKCTSVADATFAADSDRRQAASHSFISDVEVWIKALGNRPEVRLFQVGLKEYQFALLAVVQGQYRQAFMALRLSFELFLGGVHLSAKELELRIWLKGGSDLVWRSLIDDQEGVFSKRFVRAFFEDLGDKATTYRVIAEKVYRECSEYVHGNAPASATLPERIEFSPAAFAKWHDEAASIRLVVHFSLCSRYLETMDKAILAPLESVVLDNLGHIAQVRSIFGGPVEPSNA
jgi:hypothetical protein